jgi:Family of unknown function (DUF5683)
VNRLHVIFFYVFIFGTTLSFCQKEKELTLVTKDSITVKTSGINPLAPAKAAFYSAVLPGLGQAYNKKYWKIPIVYGALGTGLTVYIWNNNKYNQFRDAYKNRLAGVPDEFVRYQDETLITAQRSYARARDIGLIVTVGLYVLNIIDANVDAHLKQFNVDDKLSIAPQISKIDSTNQNQVGLTFNYKF